MIEKFQEPLLVTQSSLPDYEAYIKNIKRIWETKWLTNQGDFHNNLEKNLVKFLGVKNLTLFTNGHSALDCAVKTLLPTETGGEIITTPFTFVSTTHAIAMNGFKPVFCDIKKSNYTIDETKIENLITPKTVAIIPTHVYGYPCNVQEIEKIAQKYNLKVIYDAAHAFGVKINNTPIGTFGNSSMFSFHATKVFNTIEGGALTYNNDELKQKFNLIKNFGILNEEEIISLGINAKMNEFQAAMGIENLREIEQNINNRKLATQKYNENLADIQGIKLAKTNKGIKYNYAYMPILIDEREFGLSRDQLYNKLKDYNVFSRKYFYPLTSNTEPYKHINADVEVANYVSNRILCLPLFGSLKIEDVKKVCNIIEEIQKCN